MKTTINNILITFFLDFNAFDFIVDVRLEYFKRRFSCSIEAFGIVKHSFCITIVVVVVNDDERLRLVSSRGFRR